MLSDISPTFVNVLQYTREHGNAECSDAKDKRGILERNGLAWYARGSVLEVFNINSSFKVISHNFNASTSKLKYCTIECVEEVQALECAILAVALRVGPEQSQIVFLSLRGCCELGRIDMQQNINILRFVDPSSCSIGLLSKYQGCLACGTIDGTVILIDLCVKLSNNGFKMEICMNGNGKKQCHVEFSRGNLKQLEKHHETIKDRGIYFGLQLSHDEQASVECILDIVQLKVICIGFADGTILLWDLVHHSIMHRIAAPTENCAAVALNYVEPSDDPKACLYLWTFYAHPEGAFAFLHMVMCEEKYLQQGTFVYDQFLSCSSRLCLTSYDPGSIPLNVQAVTKKVSQEDEPITLSVLSWLGSNDTTTVLVFDLNQWYKAEMPFDCDWQQELTHMVAFQLNEESFHARINEQSLVLFRSIQRPEEHFYPSSLAFDILNFKGFNRSMHRWSGLQNKLLEYLEMDGSNSVIEPAGLYEMLCRAALFPQFHEPISPSDGVAKEQREFILSLGLEYNCQMFLQSCVQQWADGSHLGADPEQGVSLSTLTDWIWNRSKTLKTVCNRMLASVLTDVAGRQVDTRTQDALSHCTRQMKQLSELYQTILNDCQEYIPPNVQERLSKESDSISAAAEYQTVLQWMLHIGILPEGNESGNENECDSPLLVPFAYSRLSEFYCARRRMLQDDARETWSDVPIMDRLLFVDNLVERDFDAETLRKAWHEDSTLPSHPLYPPQSLQKALRILLIPNTSLERKQMILMYLLMDVVSAMEEERYQHIVCKVENFSRIFNLKIGMIRRVQAFWHLDHGNLADTVECFLSPLSSAMEYPQWHRELMVSVLLRLDSPHLALKIVQAPGSPVTPQLELETLIRNNLISEAFSLQRRTPQPDGCQLVWFVKAIIRAGKPNTLLEFALTEEEKHVLHRYLQDSQLELSDSLMLGHLLQNFQFVQAVQLVDRLGRRRNVEVHKEILGLYHSALDSTSQQLAYLTYHNQGELSPKGRCNSEEHSPTSVSPLEPLSASLIRNRADFRVRILHRSIAAIKEAAVKTGLLHDQPFLEKPSLGVFKCRPTVRSLNVCYPVRLDPSMNKRRQRECDASFDDLTADHKAPSPMLNEEDVYGNPRKRRCIGTECSNVERNYAVRNFARFDVPTPVIPEFRPMKPKFNFTSASADTATTNLAEASHSNKSTIHSPSIFLTTPPFTKKLQHQQNLDCSDAVASESHDDSYTPPGILKSTQSGLNVSLAQHDRLATEGEEKVLRFELPPDATLEDTCVMDDEAQEQISEVTTPTAETDLASTPVIRRDLDLSGMSTDDFYSPEVTMEPTCLEQVLASGGPAGRRPIHRSRSGTPVSQTSKHSGNNIAIIIEDHIVEDDFSRSDRHSAQQPAVEEQEQDIEMQVDDDEELPSKANVFVVEDSDVELAASSDEQHDHDDEIVFLDEELPNQLLNATEQKHTENMTVGTYEPFLSDPQPCDEVSDRCDGVVLQAIVEPNLGSAEEQEDGIKDHSDAIANNEEQGEDDYENDDEEGTTYDDDDDANDYDDDDDDDDEDDDQDDDSVLEVIDLSDDEEQDDRDKSEHLDPPADSHESSSTSSSESDSDKQDGMIQFSEPVSIHLDGELDDNQDAYNVDDSPLGWQYEEFNCESIPENLLNDDGEAEQEVTEQEVQQSVANPDHVQDYIQVPTTSSSTHRMEGEGSAAPTIDEEAESSEVEDLSVPQQDGTETADGVAARDLSVAGGDQWPDSVASSSLSLSAPTSNASAGAVATTSTTTTSPTTGSTTATLPRETQAQTPTQDKVFGQPKNAHELEVPAMNLSVKPDEAHGSSRKNSKGEENGLTEDARALNLSAGQQEMAVDNVDSNTEQQMDRSEDNVSIDESEAEALAHSPAAQEAQPSDTPRAEEIEGEEMQIDLRVSDDEGGLLENDGSSDTTSSKLEQQTVDENESNESVPSAVPAPAEDGSSVEQINSVDERQESTVNAGSSSSQQVSKDITNEEQHVEEESLHTLRTNVKTRLMAAMEKSGATPELPRTPSRRRSVRATSVALEETNTPISPSLSRSRRYTSMDNLTGTPDAMLPLTPRHSTRASSLAKELFATSTPPKRLRRASQASNDTEHPDSLANSPTDPVMEPPEPSERSFASSTASSTRRSMRLKKTKTVPPPESGELVQSRVGTGVTTESGTSLLSDYSSNRRLTRHQLAVMEKSLEPTASTSGSRLSVDRISRAGSKDTITRDPTEAGESDSESVVSNMSNQSSIRSTRSRSNRSTTARSNLGSSNRTVSQQKPTDPVESDSDQSLVYASSQRSTMGLEPIAEEGESNPASTRKRRGRPLTKSKK